MPLKQVTTVMIMRILDFLSDLIFPNRCGFCDELIAWDEYACDKCIDKIEFADNPIEKDNNGNFKLCVSAVHYGGAAKNGILNLKHPEGINAAKYLVPFLCESLEKAGLFGKIDIVTAVPVYQRKLSEKRYNHAEVIAKLVAKRLGCDENYKIIGRRKTKFLQRELSRDERIEAVKGVYFIKDKIPDVKGKTILVCDDIITTGSTLSDCSRLLLEAGAKEVYACALATTSKSLK